MYMRSSFARLPDFRRQRTRQAAAAPEEPRQVREPSDLRRYGTPEVGTLQIQAREAREIEEFDRDRPFQQPVRRQVERLQVRELPDFRRHPADEEVAGQGRGL